MPGNPKRKVLDLRFFPRTRFRSLRMGAAAGAVAGGTIAKVKASLECRSFSLFVFFSAGWVSETGETEAGFIKIHIYIYVFGYTYGLVVPASPLAFSLFRVWGVHFTHYKLNLWQQIRAQPRWGRLSRLGNPRMEPWKVFNMETRTKSCDRLAV